MSSIFVFGSNEAGIHGAGAARYALMHKGAVYGVGYGRQGDSFAIPTKDWTVDQLPLDTIKSYVDGFIRFAKTFNTAEFHLTKIGCGLAGFQQSDIAPMFADAPKNVFLIDDFGNVVCYASEWKDRV